MYINSEEGGNIFKRNENLSLYWKNTNLRHFVESYPQHYLSHMESSEPREVMRT